MKYYVLSKDSQLYVIGSSEYPAHMVREGFEIICESPSSDLEVISFREIETFSGELITEAYIDEEKKALVEASRTELKSIQESNEKALAYLQSTDWYIVREAETGQPTPQEIKDKRSAARQAIK